VNPPDASSRSKALSQITKAMQMVAAAKMRKAQQAALAGRPYAEILGRTLAAVADATSDGAHELLKFAKLRRSGYRR